MSHRGRGLGSRGRPRKEKRCRSASQSRDSRETPPRTTSAPLKKRTKLQSFLPCYSDTYPCITASRLGEQYARCTVCGVDISVGHSGFYDVERHVNCGKHKTKAEALEKDSKEGKPQQKPMTQFFAPQKSDMSKEDCDVMRAETLFAHFIVEHNLPLSVSDHAGELFRQMFPGNPIAKKYASGRTKTTAVIQACATETSRTIANKMKEGPFVLGTDASQEGDKKFFPLVVRSIDEQGQIHTELLSNPSLDDSATGENIFKLLDSQLKDYNIPWDNCVSLVCDNANVMTGRHNNNIII